MSLRTICDRCGVIIPLGTPIAKLELQAPGVEKFDLCPKCSKELRRFMNPSDGSLQGAPKGKDDNT